MENRRLNANITRISQFMDLNSLIEFKPECMYLILKKTQRIMNEH